MAISKEEQKRMASEASGISFKSLGEDLEEQLSKAKISQEGFESFQPTAKASAEAIGGFEGRAPGESPTAVRAQGITTAQAISSTAAKTSGNILDTIAAMMNLKKQEETENQNKIDRELKLQELNENLASNNQVYDVETGQVRGMNEDELAASKSLGLDSVTESYLKMFQNGAMKRISEIPAADRGEVVKALANAGVNPEEIALKREGVGVEGVINSLYNNYAGEGIDLSRGRGFGLLGNITGALGFDPDVTTYKKLKGGTLSAIRSFIGEKGIMTEDDAKRIEGLMPDVTSTDEEAKRAWKNINDIFKSTYGYDVIPELAEESQDVYEYDFDVDNLIENVVGGK